MRKQSPCPLWRVLVSGAALLSACDGAPEGTVLEEVGTRTSALCGGTRVDTVDLLGVSSYGGLLAGAGNWKVSGGANAIRLEYLVDGVLRSSEERPGNEGTWYLSAEGMGCGAHALLVKAYPMVIDSGGNRTTCWEAPRQLTQSVTQPCATTSVSCTTVSSIDRACTGSVSGGTGPYTSFWQVIYGSSGGWMQGSQSMNLQCPPEPYPQPASIQVQYKVRDSTGMESAPSKTSFICKSRPGRELR
jgi:hypothetical protein